MSLYFSDNSFLRNIFLLHDMGDCRYNRQTEIIYILEFTIKLIAITGKASNYPTNQKNEFRPVQSRTSSVHDSQPLSHCHVDSFPLHAASLCTEISITMHALYPCAKSLQYWSQMLNYMYKPLCIVHLIASTGPLAYLGGLRVQIPRNESVPVLKPNNA